MQACPKMQSVIEQLAQKHQVDVRTEGAYLRLDKPNFDRLVIECLPNGCISVGHFFESEGFLTPDPDVCFFVDEKRGWIPVNITQSLTGYIRCAVLSEDNSQIAQYDEVGQRNLASFCEQWAQNLIDQKWLESGEEFNSANRLVLPSGKSPLFTLGQVVATPGAIDALERTEQGPMEFLDRHVTGDWGDLEQEDAQQNHVALELGSRLFSAYQLQDGTKIWVITEWNRTVTTLLLPNEY